MQLEFGAEYRTKGNRKQIAEQLAAAVEGYAELYLNMANVIGR